MRIIMNGGNKGLGSALVLAVLAALSGCGESSDELDDKLNHDAKMSFVNSLSYMVDFHVKKRDILTGYNGLFDHANAVSRDVPTNEVGNTYHYNYKAINNMVNIGVKDSVNSNKEERINTTLSNGDNLWVIAWEASGDRTLSVIDKKKSNVANVFNVRLFANGRYDVFVDGDNVLTTEKGQITEYLKVNNCAEDLKVANNFIDLCSGNYGASYLIVVDNNGKLVMVEE